MHLKTAPGWLIVIAYCLVIAIWSTTPIAIKWSSEGVGHLFGVTLRMLIGALLSMIIVLILYRKFPLHKMACKAYTASALSLFGGMMPVYWGVQYVSSGLVAVIFGLTPMVTGYLAWRFINEKSFSVVKLLGAMAGVMGLLFIFFESEQQTENYTVGVMAVLLAVVLHSISAVWVKSIKIHEPPIILVAGGLLFSLPLFFITYIAFAPPVPEVVASKAMWSIIYLGVVGSVIGFFCYYYLLRHLPASTVALTTLITPVMALWIGYMFNAEIVGSNIYIGTVCVLFGLAIYQWGEFFSKQLRKKLNAL